MELASTNPVFRFTIVVHRQIHSFGGIMSFEIAHALFYAWRNYAFEGRRRLSYIISHPNPKLNLTIHINIYC
jgi:hypothetical protein